MPKIDPSTPSQAFMEALRSAMPAGQDCVDFASFMRIALYHPQVGYYCREKERVGHNESADFYTASSLGSVFFRLVLAAMEKLAGKNLETYTLVEFGPESSEGILTGQELSPFKDHLLVRPGQSITIPDRSIVFSNELFDAQPFRRFQKIEDAWVEWGVRPSADSLEWCHLPESLAPKLFPADAPDGYIIDWPGEASSLLQSMVRGNWKGLFIAFDYGLDRNTMFQMRPEGTARTYSRHQMGDNLLERPGEVDLTCHVIWDDLQDILKKGGFAGIGLEYQESFFMHHSGKALRPIIEDAPGSFSPDRQTLMELLHPENMGRKFQVLHANRGI